MTKLLFFAGLWHLMLSLVMPPQFIFWIMAAIFFVASGLCAALDAALKGDAEPDGKRKG